MASLSYFLAFFINSRVVALRVTNAWIFWNSSNFLWIFQKFFKITEFFCVQVNQRAKSFHLICHKQIYGISVFFQISVFRISWFRNPEIRIFNIPTWTSCPRALKWAVTWFFPVFRFFWISGIRKSRNPDCFLSWRDPGVKSDPTVPYVVPAWLGPEMSGYLSKM